MNINFATKYSNVIASKELGDTIYKDIKQLLISENLTIDFKEVDVMTSFCAKQIFGMLYIQLGADAFFDKLKFVNVSEDMKIIIRESIQCAVEQNN